jgi:hypothetical protein
MPFIWVDRPTATILQNGQRAAKAAGLKSSYSALICKVFLGFDKLLVTGRVPKSLHQNAQRWLAALPAHVRQDYLASLPADE